MTRQSHQHAIDEARRDLDRALRTGGDTIAARAALEAAEAELAQSQRQAATRKFEDAQAHQSRIETETQALVNQTIDAIEAEIAAILPGFEIAVPLVPTPAHRLVSHREELQETEDRKFAILDELSTIEGRITALEGERSAIAERRRAGQRDIQDAGQIGLIDIDLADLRVLADRCRAELEALPRNNLPALAREWDAAVADARKAALLQSCQELERRLFATARILRDLAGHSVHLRWRPGHEFETAVAQGVV